MTEPERELDDLFAELVSTEPEPRGELAEAARRRRISALIDDRLAQNDGASARAEARPGVRYRRVIWVAAAAAVLATLGGVHLLGRAPTATLEREPPTPMGPRRGQAPEETRTPLPAPVPSLLRTHDAPARAPQRTSATPVRSATPTTAASGDLPPPGPSGASEDVPQASLRAANELFQSAVRAARRGDDATALAQFDAVLERFPQSPLAADARVRKFRTLVRLGKPAEARAAASEYVERHPDGFARSEAEKVLKETAEKDPLSP